MLPLRWLLPGALSLVAACGGAPAATFSAGDLTAVQEALALRGVTVANAVSGDAGCPDSPLHSNVVRLDVSLPDEQPQRQIHLFRWRRPAQFDAAAAAFEACVARSAVAAAGAPSTLVIPPWRAYGMAWSDDLRLALEDALRSTGGG